MALPTTWPMVRVQGTYLRIDGTPNVGSIWFETAQRTVVTDDAGLVIGVLPRRVIADLDDTGSIDLLLPATDAGGEPTGWTWQVYERFNAGQAPYSIEVPQALVADGINLAQYPHAVPVPVNPPVVSYLTTADIGVTVASQSGVNAALTQSAAAVGTANAAAVTAASAQADASAAVTTANGIDAKAQSALDNSTAAVNTANTANTNASAAVTTANGIDAKAQSALDNSTAAVNTANAAQTTADGIDAKATQAQTDAANAVTTANAAQTTANAASAAVASKANRAGDTFTGPISATNLSGTNTGDQTSVTGNAGTATKLATARTISLGGLLGGSASFDGSGNVTIAATMADGALSIAKTSGLQGALDAKASLTGATFTGMVWAQSPNDASYNNLIRFGPNDSSKAAYFAVQDGAYKWVHQGWYGTGSFQWVMPSGVMSLDKSANLTVGGSVTTTGVDINGGAGEATIDFSRTGQRLLRLVYSGSSNLGFYDVTNSDWLFYIDSSNVFTFANISAASPGSTIAINSPSGLPGIIGQYGSSNRNDIAFGPGYISLGASSTTGSPSRSMRVNASGRISLSNADSSTTTEQPRIFVQSSDPGAAAADGDLWFW